MLLGVSRLMFAWAEDGIFPRAIAAVHPRFRTPHVAILASAGMATLGIVGSHVAGDFFLGVDILVTSMLVNFLLMAVSVLTLPARNAALARQVTVLPSRAAQRAARRGRHRRAGAVPRRAHVEGPDRARRRLVFALDAGLARGDGRRLDPLSVARRRSCAARAWTSTRASRRFLPDRTHDPHRGTGRPGPRSLHLPRADRPVADRRHGARRPRARSRARGAGASRLRRRRLHVVRHGRSLRVGRDRGEPSAPGRGRGASRAAASRSGCRSRGR